MLDHKYKAKQAAGRDKRNWPLTIITAFLCLFVTIGVVAVWRYVGHDGYIIVSVVVPTTVVALMLLLAAINGRTTVFKEACDAVLSLIFFWS